MEREAAAAEPQQSRTPKRQTPEGVLLTVPVDGVRYAIEFGCDRGFTRPAGPGHGLLATNRRTWCAIYRENERDVAWLKEALDYLERAFMYATQYRERAIRVSAHGQRRVLAVSVSASGDVFHKAEGRRLAFERAVRWLDRPRSLVEKRRHRREPALYLRWACEHAFLSRTSARYRGWWVTRGYGMFPFLTTGTAAPVSEGADLADGAGG
jgi:hypothetical protein